MSYNFRFVKYKELPDTDLFDAFNYPADANVDIDITLTWNLSGMLSFAFECNNWREKVQLLPSMECAPIFLKAAAKMVKERALAEVFNPSNGWGNYEIALRFLHNMVDECNKYKDYYLFIM